MFNTAEDRQMEEEVLNPISIFNTDASKSGRAGMHLAATHVFFSRNITSRRPQAPGQSGQPS